MKEDRLCALLSYLTLIGWIVALVLYNSDDKYKSSLGRFHLKQALGLILFSFIGGILIGILIAIPIVGWLISVVAAPVFGVLVLVLLILGIVNAIQGDEKLLPFIGKIADENLNFIN